MAIISEQWLPPPIPSWRAVAIVFVMSALIVVPNVWFGSAGMAMAASGGFVFGAFTIASVGFQAAVPRLVVGGLVGLVVPFLGTPWLVALALIVFAGLASVEVARHGTRCLVAAMFGCLAIVVGMARSPDGFVWLAFLTGMAGGCGAMALSGLIDVLPRSARGQAVGVVMFLFLAAGLILATTFITILGEPRSYWIAFIFVMRALVPLEAQRSTIARYGIGAGVGVVAAVLIELVNLPMSVQLFVALLAGILGLRYVAHPMPVAAAAFSAAILLGSAPTFADAIYRAEAIAIVVVIVLLLAFVLDRVWLRLSNTFA